MFKITISSYKLDNERTSELLEGFDDLDRNLKKFSIWGCHFVILQVKLDPFRPFGARQVPFDNSEYFGIFSATAQSLGMVPIIQFKIELAEYREEKSISALMDIMNTITATFFDFDVDISCLIISPLLSFSLKDIAIKKNAIANAEILINALQQGLPPAIGGVIFASDGSYKTYSLLIDQLSKIINRIPWPIVCSYEWKVPHVLESDTRNEVLEKWTNKQRVIMKVFSLASEGKLITWKGKLTSDIPDYIVTHDYYDPKYVEAMLEPPT
ncbi:fructose-bisphosphate aldolase [Halyomorpha halys]|nr:fructose-bisphosphate aldolase [Halyomorpha halys]